MIGCSIIRRIHLFMVATALLCVAATASAQTKCAALQSLNLEDLAGAPARIVSAQLVKVPTEGLKQPSRAWTNGKNDI